MIKNLIKKSFLYDYIRRFLHNIKYTAWKFRKKKGFLPHKCKQNIVLEYIKIFSPQIFVETGTYYGDMLFVVKNLFIKIYSIELSKPLAERARNRFIKYKNITILHGNSKDKLSEILSTLSKGNFFWLDAHYSSGVTAYGDKATPIEEELILIFNSKTDKNVILIDDARLFNGKNDYPTIEKVKALTLSNKSNAEFQVKDDIIRIVY